MRYSRKFRKNNNNSISCDTIGISFLNNNNILFNRLRYFFKPILIVFILLSLIYMYLNQEKHNHNFNEIEDDTNNENNLNHKRKYVLDFSSEKVRPSRGENRAFGAGYILLSNHTNSPQICWSFYAIGLITYIKDLNIHGPLYGSGENSVIANIFIKLNSKYENDRYESCIIAQNNNSTENNTLLNKINHIYKDPSRYYILASTSSRPNGALWSNFGGEWHV